MIRGGDGSHWDGCEGVHWDCKIERLETRIAELEQRLEGGKSAARQVGEYWVERLREEEARADLHAILNRKVADALGLSFGSDWAQLPKLVSALRAENERLRGFVAKLITKCEMPKNRDYHTMFQMCTMLDAIRIEALRVLHSEEDGNK